MTYIKKVSTRGRGFTLVELLVVISIIAILLAILMPSLSKAKRLAQRIVCASHLRNMYFAMNTYAQSYGCFYPARNGSYWLNWKTGETLPADYDSVWAKTGGLDAKIDGISVVAYWAVPYVKYGVQMEMFRCPAKKNSGSYTAANINKASNKDLFRKSTTNSDYGLNGFICWEDENPDPTKRKKSMEEGSWSTSGSASCVGERKLSEFKTPASTIVLQDHWEGVMDFNPAERGDSYYIPKSTSANFMQWRMEVNKPNSSIKSKAIDECLRHDGGSGLLWLDGHAKYFKTKDTESVPCDWYTGGVVKEFKDSTR